MHCDYVNSNRMEERLLEAFDALWDDFVDPREAYTDVDGEWWTPVGASGSGATRLAAPIDEAAAARAAGAVPAARHGERVCDQRPREPHQLHRRRRAQLSGDDLQRDGGRAGAGDGRPESARRVSARESLARAAAGNRPPHGPRRRSVSAVLRRPRGAHAGAVHRAGPDGHAGRAVDRSVGQLRHPDRSGRRRDGARLLRRRRAGRRGRRAASPGERRSQREARPAALIRRCGRICGGPRSCCGT